MEGECCMQKPISLNSLISMYKDLSPSDFKNSLKFYDFEFRSTEIKQIEKLIENLFVESRYLNSFYVGYKIPQIGKELDLLRFGGKYILNIEIKSVLDEDAKHQLLKNQYYLSSLKKDLFLFTYISSSNSLFQLKPGNLFEEVNFEVLEGVLEGQDVEVYTNIDELFDPSDYLVSPFNNSDRFCKDEYFLTLQQQRFKNEIANDLSTFLIIEGLPGTGKTLLLYDLAKEYKKTNKVLIVHAGNLNDGHHKLIDDYGWDIISAKDCLQIEHIQPDYIFIDETQRMYPWQLEFIIEYINNNMKKGFFSIDPKQILSLSEHNYNNIEKLKKLSNSNLYKLSKKIRTNKELGSFIKGLFNLDNMHQCRNTNNISIHYYKKITDARSHAETLESEGWQIIDYTEQRYRGERINEMRLFKGLNTHNVLGQEFDRIVVVVGPSFYYNSDNSIAVRDANHYDPERMFYQSITRARKEITLLIVNNHSFMGKLISAF